MTGKILLGAILILLVSAPPAILAQSDQRIPLEIRNQSEAKIAQAFFQGLKIQINRASKFRMARGNEPRLTLTVGSAKTENPYLDVITVIWTTEVKTSRGNLPVFLDFVSWAMSEAHSYKDAEDMLNFTEKNVVKRFRELSGQKPGNN
jgi:hypothetical protein